MNPNNQQPPIQGDFDQDPFQEILKSGRPPIQPEQPQEDPQAQLQQLQDQQDPKKNQMLPGANPGGSKFLLGAIQQIQGYIAESTERDEIAIGRSIIQLLTRLVDKDQKKMAEKIAQDNTPQQPMPQMAPQGMQAQGQSQQGGMM
jgi:hypothetical protein